MPLTPGAARELRGRSSAFHEEDPGQRYARALAWVGRVVHVRLRTGATVTGSVVGVATLPYIRLQTMDSGVLLLRRGGAAVDVYEGYALGLIQQVEEVPGAPPVEGCDRRERYD